MVPLTIPPSDATHGHLIRHFQVTGAALAGLPYERSIYACLTCMVEGENVYGKSDNPSGRARFCSEPCEAVFKRLQAFRTPAASASAIEAVR